MLKRDGRLNQRHPKKLLERADAIAKGQGLTLTDVIERFLVAYVRQNPTDDEPQAEENLGIEQA